MYLSKIEIHGKLIRNPYLLHKALWRLFPDDRNHNRDFLFRVEKRQLSSAEILLQSEREPRQESIDSIAVLASKPYHPELHQDQNLRFFVVCNPVRTVLDELGRMNAKGEIKKCRVPLIKEDERIDWLKRKIEKAAVIKEIDVQQLPPLFFRKIKEDRSGKVQPIAFRGILGISQPEHLIRIIRAGVGPAKAFGCGMVSLAKA